VTLVRASTALAVLTPSLAQSVIVRQDTKVDFITHLYVYQQIILHTKESNFAAI